MVAFGEGYPYHVTGLVHDYRGLPTQSPAMADELVTRLHTKIDRAIDEITLYTEHFSRRCRSDCDRLHAVQLV